MAEEIQSRRELAIALDAAMTRAQIAVHYQPIVDAASRDVIAMASYPTVDPNKWVKGFAPGEFEAISKEIF